MKSIQRQSYLKWRKCTSIYILFSLFLCNVNEIRAQESKKLSYTFIEGEISGMKDSTNQVDFLPSLSKFDVGNLKDKISWSNAEFQMLSIGGSFAAGYQNWGYFNKGILSSYPNLFSRQLGENVIFNSPLFESTLKNGTGYKILKSIEPLAFYDILDFSDDNFISKNELPKILSSCDNLAVPYLKIFDWNKAIGSSSMVPSRYYDRTFDPYLNRFSKNDNLGQFTFNEDVLSVRLNSQNPGNFFIAELGLQDYLSFALNGGDQLSLTYLGVSNKFAPEYILNQLKSKIGHGVVVNVPDILDFPFFHIINTRELYEPDVQVVDEYVNSLESEDIVLPTLNVLQLLNKNAGDITHLLNEDVLSGDMIELQELSTISLYNARLNEVASKLDIPVLDLFSLFKRISEEGFLTSRGRKISFEFPQGYFFSSDGVHPSEIGQAVITNELIRTVNSHYSANIPLIDIDSFFDKLYSVKN